MMFGRKLIGITAAMLLMTSVTALRPVSAGAVGGAKWNEDEVQAHDCDVYRVTFRAGEFAQIRLRSHGSTYLTLKVFDGNGNLIGIANDKYGDALVTFVPRYQGQFRIEVQNDAPIRNSYFLSTN